MADDESIVRGGHCEMILERLQPNDAGYWEEHGYSNQGSILYHTSQPRMTVLNY